MDWDRAIARNAEALISILAMLCRMLGIEEDDMPERTLPRLRYAALRILRPAESAVRRLIVIAARGIVVTLAAPRHKPPGRIITKGSKGGKDGTGGTDGKGASQPAYQLFDPRKTFTARRRRRKFTGVMPRIVSLDHDPRVIALWPAPQPVPAPEPPEDDGLVNAVPLCRRIAALQLALSDLPHQARRLARWQARRLRLQDKRPTFAYPMRPGVPPGYRRKPVHEVDHVLIECHWLAFDAIRHDTS
jgi:hypothetical protein